MLIGGTHSGASLAMAKVAREKKKVFIAIGSGTAQLTNEQCSPYTVHYAYDTVALARGTGATIVKQGGKFLVFPDRRLGLRPVARKGHDGRHQGQRRQHAGRDQAPLVRG